MAAVVETSERRSLPASDGSKVAPGRALRQRATLILLLLALAAGALTTTRWVLGPGASRPDDFISATGRIEGREVTLAPKSIRGRVARLLADEGQTVSRGQLLAELEVAQLDAQYAAASATVAGLDAQIRQAELDAGYAAKNSDASIAAAQAALATAEAHVARAQAVRANAASAFERAESLLAAGAIAQQDLERAEMALRTADADLAAAGKEVAYAQANVALARASVETIAIKRQQLRVLQESRRTAAAKLAEADANRAERLIESPLDATIVSRTVEVGDVVGPGSPLFQLVDMNRLYVKVYVPEPEIGKLRLRAAAEVGVDAFPGRSFTARVSKIYDQAEFTPKNVETPEERLKLVFGVELALDNADDVLKPGMPADCRIRWTPPAPEAGRDGR